MKAFSKSSCIETSIDAWLE